MIIVFLKMIIKIQEIFHYTKFWDNAILQSEIGQVEVEIRTVHVLAWML